MDSRDQSIADLERQLHQARVELQAACDERDQAIRRAATWRRIAQWIHEASQAPEEDP